MEIKIALGLIILALTVLPAIAVIRRKLDRRDE